MREQHEIEKYFKDASTLYSEGLTLVDPSPLTRLRKASTLGSSAFVAVSAFFAILKLPRPLETTAVVGICAVAIAVILCAFARDVLVDRKINAQTIIKGGENPPEPRGFGTRAGTAGKPARSNGRRKRDRGDPPSARALRHHRHRKR
jgi:hypothetical protein